VGFYQVFYKNGNYGFVIDHALDEVFASPVASQSAPSGAMRMSPNRQRRQQIRHRRPGPSIVREAEDAAVRATDIDIAGAEREADDAEARPLPAPELLANGSR